MVRHRIATAVLLVLAGAIGCRQDAHREADLEEHHGSPVTVECQPIRAMPLEHVVRGIGTITSIPSHEAIIAPGVEGIVAEILVQEGDEVQAGQPIVRLDDRLAQRELVERTASRAELDAALTLLKTPPRAEERRVADLEVERAHVAEELARTALDRITPLHRRKEASDQQFFEAEQRLRDATLAREVAEGRRTVLLLGPKPEAIAESEAKIRRADEAIQSIETRLSYFTLKAPSVGVVEKIVCHPGQLLSAGGVAAEILDISEVLATLGVPARDARLIRKGQQARVLLGGIGSAVHKPHVADSEEDEPETIEGEVVFVGAEAMAETGTIPIRVLVKNSEEQLRLHTVVAIEIVVNVVADALVVPEEAVIELEEGPTLAIVHEGKSAIVHPTLGVRHHGLVQVIDDELHAGDLVITRGGYNLPEDTPVVVQSGKEAAEGEEP